MTVAIGKAFLSLAKHRSMRAEHSHAQSSGKADDSEEGEARHDALPVTLAGTCGGHSAAELVTF